jgi:hypothetical protein
MMTLDPDKPLSPEDLHDTLAEIPDNAPYAWALSHRCPTCGAEPGEDCDAPRRLARHNRIYEIRVRAGMRPVAPSKLLLVHARRQDREAGRPRQGGGGRATPPPSGPDPEAVTGGGA